MIQRLLPTLWLLSLGVYLALAGLVLAQSQTDPTLTAENRATLLSFAPYLPGEPAMLDRHLEALGFRPETVLDAQLASEYPTWPDVRKLDFARRAAIADGGEPAGADFLSDVARMIAATQSDSIRFEPGLASMFPESPETVIEPPRNARAFKAPSTTQLDAPLDPAARELVFLINKYTSATPGGTPRLMQICCRLADGQIADILLESRSSVAALERAIVTSPIPPALQDKLQRSLRHLMSHHASLQLETLARNADRALSARGKTGAEGDIARLADEMVRQALEGAGVATDLIDQTLAEGPSRGGSSPLELTRNREAFVSRLKEIDENVAARVAQRLAAGMAHGVGPALTAGLVGNSATAAASGNGAAPNRKPSSGDGIRAGNRGGLSFSRATGSANGFGGVVFGNVLAEDLPPLALMRWIPSYELADRAFGQVEVTFENGATARSAILPEDIVSPAALLVFSETAGGLDRLDVEASGAVPLAGVERSSTNDPIALALQDGQISEVKADGFVINPALEGTRLGEAAVLADVVYAVKEKERFGSLGDTMAPTNAVREDFSTWLGMGLGFYKITDAPLEIIWDGAGWLDVRAIWPEGAGAETDEDLHSHSLLTMRTFDRFETPRDEFGTPFHRLVPLLADIHPGFSDLNAFAEAFALARWAALDGLTEISDLPELTRGPLRRHVIVSDQSVQIINPNEIFARNTELLRSLISIRMDDPKIVESLQNVLGVALALHRLQSLTADNGMDTGAIQKAMTDLWTTRVVAVQNSLLLAANLPESTEESLQSQYVAAGTDYMNAPYRSAAEEEAFVRRLVIGAIMGLGDASIDEVDGALRRALSVVLNHA